jgi:hypothetical protein
LGTHQIEAKTTRSITQDGGALGGVEGLCQCCRIVHSCEPSWQPMVPRVNTVQDSVSQSFLMATVM